MAMLRRNQSVASQRKQPWRQIRHHAKLRRLNALHDVPHLERTKS